MTIDRNILYFELFVFMSSVTKKKKNCFQKIAQNVSDKLKK